MKSVILILVIASSLFINSTLSAQVVTNENLEILTGGTWKGELTYKNYGDGKMVSIPVELTVTKLKENLYEFAYNYINEPHANSKAKVKIKSDGKMVFDQQVVSAEPKGKDGLILTTASSGKDGGKKSSFQFTYEISSNSFVMTKNVTYNGETESFKRNEYRFTR